MGGIQKFQPKTSYSTPMPAARFYFNGKMFAGSKRGEGKITSLSKPQHSLAQFGTLQDRGDEFLCS